MYNETPEQIAYRFYPTQDEYGKTKRMYLAEAIEMYAKEYHEAKVKNSRLHGVVGRSEQFVCLCPRNETDNCDRKEPCKECKTCPHLRQTNCH